MALGNWLPTWALQLGLAIAWLLAQGDHVVPIPGTRSVAHLNELAAGVELSLTATDWQP